MRGFTTRVERVLPQRTPSIICGTKINQTVVVCATPSARQPTNAAGSQQPPHNIESGAAVRSTLAAATASAAAPSAPSVDGTTAAAAAAPPRTAPPSQQQPLSAPPPPIKKKYIPSRLKSWLRGGTETIPLASQLDVAAPSPSDLDDFVGDGMAAVQPTPLARYRARFRRSNTSTTSPSLLEHRPVKADHATLQLLRQRAIAGSRPGARKDPFKFGLVVEGGGMRGCVSGGALQALSDLGLMHVFDSVYGSSAGAINSTFFLSGQRDGVNIYHDHIATEDFVDLRRLFTRKTGQPPALNLTYLLEHVMETEHPLNYDLVLASPVPLKVVASSLDTLRPVLFDNFTDKHDLRGALRASATVPEVAGGPVEYRGQRLVDAAVFEPVPFRSAIADGCTHVLVLCTRPAPPARRSAWADALADAVESAVKKAVLSPEYMVPMWQAEVEALEKDGITQDEMLRQGLEEGAADLPWFAGAHVFPVYPSAANASISPLCIDVPRLKGGVAEGRRSVINVVRAALGDVVDFTRVVGQEAANIVPLGVHQVVDASGRRALRENYLFNGQVATSGASSSSSSVVAPVVPLASSATAQPPSQ